jgi:hypothetical protein
MGVSFDLVATVNRNEQRPPVSVTVLEKLFGSYRGIAHFLPRTWINRSACAMITQGPELRHRETMHVCRLVWNSIGISGEGGGRNFKAVGNI